MAKADYPDIFIVSDRPKLVNKLLERQDDIEEVKECINKMWKK